MVMFSKLLEIYTIIMKYTPGLGDPFDVLVYLNVSYPGVVFMPRSP